MLEKLSDYLIAVLELLEAEGRSASRNVVAIGTKLALIAGGGILLTIAFTVFGWSLFLVLTPVWGQAGAALACGALLLLSGGGVLWFANRKNSRQ